MDVKGIHVALLDKSSDPPSPPFFSDQEDNADPLFQILHTSPAQITSCQRGYPRKGVSPKVAEKTITCPYAEVLNEIDASNGPLFFLPFLVYPSLLDLGDDLLSLTFWMVIDAYWYLLYSRFFVS